MDQNEGLRRAAHAILASWALGFAGHSGRRLTLFLTALPLFNLHKDEYQHACMLVSTRSVFI